MKRRDFMLGLGAAACSFLPYSIQAEQPGRVYRLGVLSASPRSAPHIAAFFDELQRLDFVDGQNLRIDSSRGLQGDLSPENLVAMREFEPDVIVSSADRWSRPLHSAMPNVPLVCLSADLLRSGLLNSLARPASNLTGVSFVGPELDGKRQEILLEAVPGARRIAILEGGNATPPEQIKPLQEAAHDRRAAIRRSGNAACSSSPRAIGPSDRWKGADRRHDPNDQGTKRGRTSRHGTERSTPCIVAPRRSCSR